ncbi:cytochrome P450 2U1-like [Patiria miniata]|uniref:Cytochrome P450 n=1 Tax=Patiria miniata TaxID=46514 RepID=A0A913YYV4_PATMI|nr:cytochrome P450 2U1-like [Patiria miniata]XP_038044903.1 cytochrome P450 2U1-like [Patiria miniata]XP_038044904.1 cytochrome P450 2U1-like [Patiria miniata]XP_038044905.1 cytochrome P450 2U1-like [Patiria miniata]XP_038044906.1 cytochrome P450 2U1-like [Patiria miniata]XP_038044907.1 cytochrome P450 2U1-like [Patiria miniata]
MAQTEVIHSSLTIESSLVFLGVFVLVVWLLRRPRNLPPGPTGLPFIGYLPKLALQGDEYKSLALLANTYGDVFSFNLGGQLVVVLNSYEAIKKALAHPNTSDRPPTPFYIKATPDKDALGVASASGQSWTEQRKFSLKVLRGLGVGKSSFQDAIAGEAGYLIGEMKNLNQKPLNPTTLVGNAVSNVICSVTLGKRFEYSDGKFQELLRMINRNFELVGGGSMYQYVPFVQYLTFIPTFTEVQSNVHKIVGFLKENVDEHRQNLDPDNPRDFMDVFLGEIQSNERNNIKSHISPSNMLLTVFEIFVGGTETTSSTLCWALLYMLAHPEVQSKVQREIDEVVGRNRLPRIADKPELSYTEATIMEVQRIASVGALGVPHMFSQDTSIFGYDMPRNTILISNLWAVSRDPNLWPEPEKFRPERFLDGDGKVRLPEEHLPFSTGRRVCLGEQLAKMELFIFFSFLLHQFTFKKPEDAPPISLKAVNGFTLTPTPFEICAVLRE